MKLAARRAQGGVALFVGLIILLLITLMLVTAFNLASSNVRVVGNMQFRDEALAAAGVAIDRVVNSPFTASPRAEQILVDVDGDGANDYAVSIATPVCVMASRATEARKSSLSLPVLLDDGDWNTTWQIDATVTAHSANQTGASVAVREGVRVLLDNSAKALACGVDPP